MFDPRTIAASAPQQVSVPLQQAPAADDFGVFLHLLGGPFRKFGTPPPSGAFDIPAVDGSASDVQRSHMGTAAQKGEWR